MAIGYALEVTGSGQDGFNFSIQPGATACFALDAPPGVPVWVGPSKSPVPSVFDFATFSTCSLP
jgi:hypothetical protein